MENTKIMNNEVIEATEEVIENTGMSKGVKIAAGIGLSVVVGYVVYKYVAKPVVANIIDTPALLPNRSQQIVPILHEKQPCPCSCS